LNTIIVDQKPEFGKLQRTCRACSDPYEGYNMYLCPDCERSGHYIIQEKWADDLRRGEELRRIADGLTEAEARELFRRMCLRFAWSGTIFVREDLEAQVIGEDEAWEDEDDITDAEWDVVSRSSAWLHAVVDQMHSIAMPCIHRYADGSFVLPDEEGSVIYNADGTVRSGTAGA
jgi:hypothetical protein